MDRSQIPFNALRAFEAAARHLNFTRAALELRVSQTALSHQIRTLEDLLGQVLFRRLPRGVALTDEGAALVPVLTDAFDRIGSTLDRFADGRVQHIVNLGVVSTFAVGWLVPRLPRFAHAYPQIDLRIMTNNNRVDLAGEGLDLAIRFGEGAWHGTEATALMEAPLTPMCAPSFLERIAEPRDLAALPLLRSYRPDEWSRWFGKAGVPAPRLHGPMFDSSIAIAQAAIACGGIALLPRLMFMREIEEGRLACPFDIEVSAGRYWLTRLQTHAETPGMAAFKDWLLGEAAEA